MLREMPRARRVKGEAQPWPDRGLRG